MAALPDSTGLRHLMMTSTEFLRNSVVKYFSGKIFSLQDDDDDGDDDDDDDMIFCQKSVYLTLLILGKNRSSGSPSIVMMSLLCIVMS